MSHIVRNSGPRVLSQLSHCYQNVNYHSLTLRGYCSALSFLARKNSKTKTRAQTELISLTSRSHHEHGCNSDGFSGLFATTFCYGRKENVAIKNRLFENKREGLQSLSVCGLSSTSRKWDINKKEEGSASGQVNENAVGDEKAQYKTWKALLTVPNFLTATRIVLTPYLGYLVVSGSYEYACGLFLFAGITDMLDGWIARRFPSQSTPVGSFMDPLADKFLVSTLFITLTIANLIPVPLTLLVVARDISLIAAAFYVRIISLPPPITLAAVFDLSNQTAELKPTLISKANTVIQLGLIVSTLGAPVFNYVDHAALQALWVLTAGTTLWSGIGYVFAKNTFKVFKERRLMRKQ